MRAYYNEIDPFAAAWLRALIAKGVIAPGDVDERSITEVAATDLVGYDQCHFFAGIGVWSYALRRAGWPDDRPVWTGSCPCQPFSSAGKGLGTDDERHLWPEFARLIRERRPPVVVGEQVASAAGRTWLDAVHADLEALGYACGAADLCAAGVGAPHIRQRLYWVADAASEGRRSERPHGDVGDGHETLRGGAPELGRRGPVRGVGDASGAGSQGRVRPGDVELHGAAEPLRPAPATGASGGLADAAGGGHGEYERDTGAVGGAGARHEGEEPEPRRAAQAARNHGEDGRPGADHGVGGAADWLFCTDGKWRPVEPGTFPLAHGTPARVGRLRGYGNAIHAEVATEFIAAYLEARAD